MIHTASGVNETLTPKCLSLQIKINVMNYSDDVYVCLCVCVCVYLSIYPHMFMPCSVMNIPGSDDPCTFCVCILDRLVS